MKILIDADGCPVVDITVQLALKKNIECIILCDTSHHFEKKGARTITVSKGADSVDFALVNLIKQNDMTMAWLLCALQETQWLYIKTGFFIQTTILMHF